MSQGTLQYSFEFQWLVCDLLEMDVANSSVYDGASAVGRGRADGAADLAARAGGARRLGTPGVSEVVIGSYLDGRGIDLVDLGGCARRRHARPPVVCST